MPVDRDWIDERPGWAYGAWNREGGRDYLVAVLHVETGYHFWIRGPDTNDMRKAALITIDTLYRHYHEIFESREPIEGEGVRRI